MIRLSPLALLLAIAVVLAGVRGSFGAAEVDEEQQLIHTLQSNCTLAEKDAACARLQHIGSARSVPALAALLNDEELSHSARYALESMSLAEAGAALLQALPNSSGLVKVGIVNSLGARRETDAAPALKNLLHDVDPEITIAAARALGQIGGAQALKVLRAFAKGSSGPAHTATTDALLRCAERLLRAGDRSKARSVYELLYAQEKDNAIRVAAFRGLIRASGSHSGRLMTSAIAGPPGPQQTAALQLVHEREIPAATEAVVKLLPRVAGPVQIALLAGLRQRGDPAAGPAITEWAGHVAPEARVALISALGTLGDASDVALLSEFAASGQPEERQAARVALTELRRGNVAEVLLNQLPSAGPEVRAELALALGMRGDKAAVPRLFEIARRDTAPARKGAVQALALLADQSELPGLVELVLQAKDPRARTEAVEALNTASQHLQSRYGQIDVGALVTGLSIGSRDARLALLPICSGLPYFSVRVALRKAILAPDPELHAAALRALCDTTDAELLEDLVNLAGSPREEHFHSLAIEGGVRLAARDDKSARLSKGQRLAWLRALLAVAGTPEQKRQVLSGLAEIADTESLTLLEPWLDDAAVQNEAARAVTRVALALPATQAQESMASLKKALAAASQESTRQTVAAALTQIEAGADCVTDWQVTGPYRRAGLDYSALFDVVFPPETDRQQEIKWQILPAHTDPKRPWVMDLLKPLGGEQCVAYARTWIRSDGEQAARLELGSDDGLKVWLNGILVHSVNTARELQPASDKVNVTLLPGWNLLLLKITQNSKRWAFCARLLKPDGSHLDGLHCEAAARVAENSPRPQ